MQNKTLYTFSPLGLHHFIILIFLSQNCIDPTFLNSQPCCHIQIAVGRGLYKPETIPPAHKDHILWILPAVISQSQTEKLAEGFSTHLRRCLPVRHVASF